MSATGFGMERDPATVREIVIVNTSVIVRMIMLVIVTVIAIANGPGQTSMTGIVTGMAIVAASETAVENENGIRKEKEKGSGRGKENGTEIEGIEIGGIEKEEIEKEEIGKEEIEKKGIEKEGIEKEGIEKERIKTKSESVSGNEKSGIEIRITTATGADVPGETGTMRIPDPIGAIPLPLERTRRRKRLSLPPRGSPPPLLQRAGRRRGTRRGKGKARWISRLNPQMLN